MSDRGRFPRKAAVREFAAMYTTGMHKYIRKNRMQNRTYALRPRDDRSRGAPITNWALAHLMRDTRMRAPHKPLGCDNVTTLYRGLTLPKRQVGKETDDIDGAFLADPSFASFSPKKETADYFTINPLNDDNNSEVPVMLVLRTSDVMRGTPWLWFGNVCGRRPSATNKDRLPSAIPIEQEVLLPPGTYNITRQVYQRYSNGDLSAVLWYVTYEPFTGARSMVHAPGYQGHRARIFPRSYRRPTANNSVEGYVPLHTLFNSTNRPRSNRPRSNRPRSNRPSKLRRT
jgi:hypothetical protein